MHGCIGEPLLSIGQVFTSTFKFALLQTPHDTDLLLYFKYSFLNLGSILSSCKLHVKKSLNGSLFLKM